MKKILYILLILQSVTGSAQVTFDSLSRMVKATKQIEPCTSFVTGTTTAHEQYELRQLITTKLKAVSFKDDTCVSGFLITGKVNCKGEVGSWVVKVPDYSYAQYSCTAEFLKLILAQLSTITHTASSRDFWVDDKVKILYYHGKLSVN